jgi:ferredoxin-NADP reductase
MVKEVFKYAYERDLMDTPIQFGRGFEKPSAILKRGNRRVAEPQNRRQPFQPSEIRRTIAIAIITNSAGELLKEADVFLCGPPAMTAALLRMLRSLGVPAKRIHYERFAL